MRLVEYINELEQGRGGLVNVPDIQAAPHERIGALLVIEKLQENIASILRYLHENKYPVDKVVAYAEYAKPAPAINADDIQADAAFIARMIMGLKYKNFKPEFQIRNCFIELLNGRDFDVDKLDYIIRDTKMSGISNTAVDVERLVGALTLITYTKFKDLTFDEQNGEFPDRVLIRRLETAKTQKLYIDGILDGIIHLKNGVKVTIFPEGSFLSLKAPDDLSDGNRNVARLSLLSAVSFDDKTELYVDNQENRMQPNSYDKKRIIWSDTANAHSITLRNATVKNEPFYFQVAVKGLLDLAVKGKCVLEIDGLMTLDSAWFQGSLSGGCSKSTVVEDLLMKQDRVPTPNEYNAFTLGFKKQAINLISNVMDARDYLYLWIYAHHKVVYYANFLIPTLTQTVSRIVLEGDGAQFPSWQLSYANIGKLDDNYLLTAMKYIAEYCNDKYKIDSRERKLLKELSNRKYKKSLYKSLAEYDMLFSDFTLEQRQTIRRSLVGISDRRDGPEELVNNGFLSEETIQNISNVSGIQLDFIEDIVWVDANYRSKRINFEDTYCVFPEQTVTMRMLDLMNAPFQNKETSHYFYIYYDVKSEWEDSPARLKAALKCFFNEIINL